MFTIDRVALIANLESIRARLCCYSPGRCDCKFGASGKGEQTGCPEVRQAIKALSRGEIDQIAHDLAKALHLCQGFLPLFIEDGPKLRRAEAADDQVSKAMRAYCRFVGIRQADLNDGPA